MKSQHSFQAVQGVLRVQGGPATAMKPHRDVCKDLEKDLGPPSDVLSATFPPITHIDNKLTASGPETARQAVPSTGFPTQLSYLTPQCGFPLPATRLATWGVPSSWLQIVKQNSIGGDLQVS